MFAQADAVEPGSVVRADVAVAGAGAAGITLARELSGHGLTVVVLESGDFEYDEDVQALYDGTTSGTDYDLAASRLRYFGGTTNHWGGWSRPLDPIDFEARSWVPNSGWPLRRDELLPYYQRAVPVALRIEPDTFDWVELRDDPARHIESLADTESLTNAVYRIGATRFGEAYRDDLDRAEDVTVYLGANVVNVAVDAGGSHVTGFDVATLDGNGFRVEAREYVVALGGIDNARLLLASRDASDAGIGNDHDLVGRYFMDHVEGTVATVVLREPAPDVYLGGRPDIIRAALTFTPDAQRENELADVAFVIEEFPYSPPANLDDTVPPEAVADVLRAIEGGATVPYSVHMRAEPEPNPDSRVTLTDEADDVGMPRVDVHRVLTDEDHRRLRRAVELLAAELGRAGLGWLRLDEARLGDDDVNLFYGFHHMGTTRMSEDPATGVVDPDGRVYGVDNLWIAGSSVFPAAGHSNPTLTIVALSLRLADELVGQLT